MFQTINPSENIKTAQQSFQIGRNMLGSPQIIVLAWWLRNYCRYLPSLSSGDSSLASQVRFVRRPYDPIFIKVYVWNQWQLRCEVEANFPTAGRRQALACLPPAGAAAGQTQVLTSRKLQHRPSSPPPGRWQQAAGGGPRQACCGWQQLPAVGCLLLLRSAASSKVCRRLPPRDRRRSAAVTCLAQPGTWPTVALWQ